MAAPLPGFVHPTAVIGSPPEHRDWREGTQTGPGVAVYISGTAQINAFTTVDAGIERTTMIGDRTFLMAHVHVGHDAVIGDDCELAPGTVIAGHAQLGNGVRCGIGTLVLPFKKIGDGARIGAGAVVTKDIPAGEVWVGNPARKLEKKYVTGEVLTAAEQQGWDDFASTACA